MPISIRVNSFLIKLKTALDVFMYFNSNIERKRNE